MGPNRHLDARINWDAFFLTATAIASAISALSIATLVL